MRTSTMNTYKTSNEMSNREQSQLSTLSGIDRSSRKDSFISSPTETKPTVNDSASIERDFSDDRDRVSLSFSIFRVTPVSVILSVNVTKQAMVWCGAWLTGEYMNFTSLQQKKYGMMILDNGKYTLRPLKPSTPYHISCTAYTKSGYMKETPEAIKKIVTTTDTDFRITKVTFVKDEITVFVESNMDITTICFLFNAKGIKVDSKQYDVNNDSFVLFKVPTSTHHYSVQCSVFNNEHKLYTSTESVTVSSSRFSTMEILLFSLVLMVLVVITIVVLVVKQKRKNKSTYELDENEIVTLLNKTQSDNSAEKEGETISVNRTIRCSKCGFINPPNSTVCRDCNSLLKGDPLFSSISRKVYYIVYSIKQMNC